MAEKNGYPSAPPPEIVPGLPSHNIPGAPPSYAESLHHPIVTGNGGFPYSSAQSGPASFYGYPGPGQYAPTPSMYSYQMPQQPIGNSGQTHYGKPPTSAYPQQQAPVNYQPYQQPLFYPGQNVLVKDGFDAGARFNAISRPNIPPPPPGIAPNAAQLAAAAGANVSVSKKGGSFFSGGSSGGYTFW